MTHQDTANVRLVELHDAPYREYRKHLVRDYAADKVRAGAWSKPEAESRATKDVDGLLPEGPATRNHFLYSVSDDAAGAEVGTVWFALSTSGCDLPDYASLMMRSDLLKLMQPHC